MLKILRGVAVVLALFSCGALAQGKIVRKPVYCAKTDVIFKNLSQIEQPILLGISKGSDKIAIGVWYSPGTHTLTVTESHESGTTCIIGAAKDVKLFGIGTAI